LLHPIFGIDHILAMIMVGTFAVQLGGRAIILVPGAFVAAMAIGGILGLSGVHIGASELGIALSVLTLGAAVACRVNPATPAAMAVVGFFGLFHGHAHGVEMPESAAGLAYGAGFLLTTALLHAAGIGIGLSTGSKRRPSGAIIRSLGAIVALVGAVLIVEVI
jgi:urease accessory protein